MLKEEFEKLVKKEVTTEEFEAWERAYMTSDSDKFEFCKAVKNLVKGVDHKVQKPTAYLCLIQHTYRCTMEINISTGKVELADLEEIKGGRPWGARWFSEYDLASGNVVIKNIKAA